MKKLILAGRIVSETSKSFIIHIASLGFQVGKNDKKTRSSPLNIGKHPFQRCAFQLTHSTSDGSRAFKCKKDHDFLFDIDRS